MGCILTHSTRSEIERGGPWFVTAIDPPLPLFLGNNLAAFQKEVIARLSLKKLSLNVEALDIYCPIIATLFWNNITAVTGSFQNNLLCPNGFQAWVCQNKDCPCSINWRMSTYTLWTEKRPKSLFLCRYHRVWAFYPKSDYPLREP